MALLNSTTSTKQEISKKPSEKVTVTQRNQSLKALTAKIPPSLWQMLMFLPDSRGIVTPLAWGFLQLTVYNSFFSRNT